MSDSEAHRHWHSLLKMVLVGRRPARTLVRASALALGIFLIARFVVTPVRIVGISMYPTYESGQLNLVNRLAYTFRTPRRGDIVAVSYRADQKASGLAVSSIGSVLLLKRIVGLPGETIAISNGIVFINGVPLDEPYVKLRARWHVPPITLASNEYFLIGDNRGMDQRDHEFGRASAQRIVGKVLW